jgi:hypothetical protein
MRSLAAGERHVRAQQFRDRTMSRATINVLVAGGAGLLGLGLYGGLILRPAWSAYSRLWQRLAATVLTLYVLAVLVGVGVVAALVAVYFWG